MSEYTILFFKAKWCGPCKKITPQFDSFIKDYDIKVKKIDIDEFPELTEKYNIKAVPTFVLKKNGKYKIINSFDKLKDEIKKLI